MKKILYITLYIIAGLLLVADLFIFVSSINSFKGTSQADAVVSNVRTYEDIQGNTHYDVFVDFTANGTAYQSIAIDDDTSTYAAGDKLSIYYSQLPPQTVRTKLFYHNALVIFILIAFIFAAAGTGFLIWERKSKK